MSAYVHHVERVDPLSAPVGVSTQFTLYGTRLPDIEPGISVRIELWRLAMVGSFVEGIPIKPPLTINEGGIHHDRVLTTGTISDEGSGPLAVLVTMEDTRSSGGVVSRAIFPPEYGSLLLGKGISPAAIRQDIPWPRLVDGFGIHSFTPAFAPAMGGTLLKIALADPKSTIPSYLRSILDIHSVKIKFTAKGTFGSSLGILPQVDSSEETNEVPTASPSLDLASALEGFKDVTDPSSTLAYAQDAWLSPAVLTGDDTRSLISVLTPRVALPGLYSVSIAVNGQIVFSPTMGVPVGGGQGDIFLYESGTFLYGISLINSLINFTSVGGVLPNNSSYTVAGPTQTGVIVVVGQFLPPA